ncbi:MAG TPA: helix-turn-helix transcriptional regulator [Candidatus Acidoferrum sp.]|nr:helix-turn-helix transcriptional regulator [Candidatus Acidoferrum sp.]
MRPGERLKELRSRLGITTRDVTEKSQRIAEAEGNEEFYISNAWLTQIENTHATPSIYKLYSISTIYHVRFTDLLLLFGVDLQKIGKHQLSLLPEHTQLTTMDTRELDQAQTVPVRFDRDFDQDKTNLLSRMVQVWGEIPVALVQHLDIKHSQYGYVGLQDHTLFPLIRPGSFVQIDETLRKVRTFKWRSEFERPIYFVELRDGYACSWCELQGNKLLLVPHPLSPCTIRQFVHRTDVEIVGQVTGVAMRIVELEDSPSSEPAD